MMLRAPFAELYNVYDVGPGGQRFLAMLSEERQMRRLLTVVSDWRAVTKK